MSETKTAVQAAEEFLRQWDTPEHIQRYGPISPLNVAYILATARRLDDLAERIEKLRIRNNTLAERVGGLESRCNDHGMEAMGYAVYGGGDLIEPEVTAVKPREQNAYQTIGEQTTGAEIQRYMEWIAELEKTVIHYKLELELRKRELQNEIDVWKERAEKAEAEVAETRRLLDADDGRTTLLSQIHRLTAERDAALESANFVRGTCDLWQKHTEKAEAELERIQQAWENVINSPTAAEGELSITNERIEELERRFAIAERDHRAMEWLRKMKHTLNYEASPAFLFGGDSPGWYININQHTVQDPADAILAAADNKESKTDPAFRKEPSDE